MNVNPYFRMTAYECLRMKVFDPIRDMTKERILEAMHMGRLKNNYGNNTTKQQSNQKSSLKNLTVLLDVDKEDAFDYENPTNVKYSLQDIKKMLATEVLKA
jgi:hypothetical protein